jgi:2-dehydro-3-deoxyglucarate aldolase/4-hydroxy-2-oxoheptanedioate aldolase
VGQAGIDALWVGHFDLSATMGIPGHFERPEFLRAVDRIVGAAQAEHKPVGIMAANVGEAEAYLRRGFRLIAFGSDIGLYQQALRAGVDFVKSFDESSLQKQVASGAAK